MLKDALQEKNKKKKKIGGQVLFLVVRVILTSSVKILYSGVWMLLGHTQGRARLTIAAYLWGGFSIRIYKVLKNYNFHPL